MITSEMKVPFLDLRVRDEICRKKYLNAIERVLLHGQVVIGPEVDQLEKKIAHMCGCRYVVGVSSGTDALFMALRALGIGPGHEVITSAISFVATANVIRLNQALPILGDVGDEFNLDMESVRRLITEKTKAILPVHYAGKMVDMEKLNKIAEEFDLKVIEDASQAFGAEQNGKFAGTFGDIGCISLNPMKVLSGIGESGILLTDDVQLRDLLIKLRYNGLENRTKCVHVSSNFKIDTIHAAVLLAKLETIHEVIDHRRKIADRYTGELAPFVQCPQSDTAFKHVYYTYTIRTDRRDALQEYLEKKGIEVKIYHTVISDEPAHYDVPGECANAKRLYSQKLALPCNENLTESQLEYVIHHVKRFFKN